LAIWLLCFLLRNLIYHIKQYVGERATSLGVRPKGRHLCEKILTPSDLSLWSVFTNISSSHYDYDVSGSDYSEMIGVDQHFVQSLWLYNVSGYDYSDFSMNRALFLFLNGVGHAVPSISIWSYLVLTLILNSYATILNKMAIVSYWLPD